ncbi:MAG: hypothetical protein AAF604_04545 [Acidobacteriota bacterium]
MLSERPTTFVPEDLMTNQGSRRPPEERVLCRFLGDAKGYQDGELREFAEGDEVELCDVLVQSFTSLGLIESIDTEKARAEAEAALAAEKARAEAEAAKKQDEGKATPKTKAQRPRKKTASA